MRVLCLAMAGQMDRALDPPNRPVSYGIFNSGLFYRGRAIGGELISPLGQPGKSVQASPQTLVSRFETPERAECALRTPERSAGPQSCFGICRPRGRFIPHTDRTTIRFGNTGLGYGGRASRSHLPHPELSLGFVAIMKSRPLIGDEFFIVPWHKKIIPHHSCQLTNVTRLRITLIAAVPAGRRQFVRFGHGGTRRAAVRSPGASACALVVSVLGCGSGSSIPDRDPDILGTRCCRESTGFARDFNRSTGRIGPTAPISRPSRS